MNVVAIQGSPRHVGNTDIVLNAVLAGVAESKPSHLTVIHAADKRIAGCRECFTCQAVPDSPGCAIKDDMVELYAAMLGADLVILASPVFCWGFSAQLKAVLDRLYACFKFNETPPRCLLAGKKLALVVTAGGEPTDGADLCETAFARLAEFGGASEAKRFVAPSLKGPNQTRHDTALLERARQFGRSLV